MPPARNRATQEDSKAEGINNVKERGNGGPTGKAKKAAASAQAANNRDATGAINSAVNNTSHSGNASVSTRSGTPSCSNVLSWHFFGRSIGRTRTSHFFSNTATHHDLKHQLHLPPKNMLLYSPCRALVDIRPPWCERRRKRLCQRSS